MGADRFVEVGSPEIDLVRILRKICGPGFQGKAALPFDLRQQRGRGFAKAQDPDPPLIGEGPAGERSGKMFRIIFTGKNRDSQQQPQKASLDGGPGPVSGFQQIRKLGEGKKAASQVQRPPGQLLRKIRRQGGKAAVQQKAFQGRAISESSRQPSRRSAPCSSGQISGGN